VFSALGLLFSDFKMNETAPFLHLAKEMPLDRAEQIYRDLAGRIARELGEPSAIRFERLADARFAGQAFELTIPVGDGPLDANCIDAFCGCFAAEHTRRYGHAFSGRFTVEVVNLRLVGTRSPERHPGLPKAALGSAAAVGQRLVHFGPGFGELPTPVIDRGGLGLRPLHGPIIIEEYEGTAIVPPDGTARLDSAGSVLIALAR
jgi:N-methylhydantoinase A